jgi:ABC-2 type transport system permease protein
MQQKKIKEKKEVIHDGKKEKSKKDIEAEACTTQDQKVLTSQKALVRLSKKSFDENLSSFCFCLVFDIINFMKKYYQVFKNQLHRKLERKFDFFLNRLRSIVSFLILYFVWINAASTKSFAGYSKSELVTYVVAAGILSAFLFGVHPRDVTSEINSGNISAILVKPVNYFWYVFARETAERLLSFVFSVIEIAVLWLFLRFTILVQTDPKILILFVISMIFALTIYHLTSYAVSLSSFWSREADGPKWLFEWVVVFASGQYYPLSILAPLLHVLILALPFSLMLYFPILIYLGKLSFVSMSIGILGQIFWMLFMSWLVSVLWKKGLKIYSSEGI